VLWDAGAVFSCDVRRDVSLREVARKGEIVMNRFWRIFWKAFGMIVLGALVVAVIAGMVTRSVEIMYQIAQKALASAMGICGAIGLTVPIGLYLDERKRKEGKSCC
jgi:uncharacterized membrane protein YraQ (UPF0718 family)